MFYSTIVSFILGIVFEKNFNFGWSFGVLIFLISLFLFLFFKKQNKDQVLEKNPESLIFVLLGIAFGLGILRMDFVDVSPDSGFAKLVGQEVTFEAAISEEPDVRDTSARYTVKPDFSLEYVSECTDIFLLENSSCSPQSDSQGIHKHIPSKSLILLIVDRFPEFKYGDQIRVSGKLDLPKNFTGDNGLEFDYVNYLAKDKIHFLVYYPKIEKLKNNEGNKIISFLYSLKNIFIEKISNVVPEPNSSLLAGVIFGTKQSLGQDLLDDFKKVGLIHIVVLSGYNITIIAAGVFFAGSYFGKRNLSFLLSIIFISLFALMVGLTATVIRACIMAFIAILARFLGRPTDALRWLFIAGFLMLFWNPLLLFYDPSFQLSFMATLGLILFSQIIFDFISCRKICKFIPTKFGIREIVASTFAVQLFILPLLIKMSGFVSIISFLINPIILPTVPWLMAFGAITGALGIIPFVGTTLSWPFGVLSYLISQIIISLTEFSASLPFATMQTGRISFWIIILWYVGYGFVFYKIQKSNLSLSLL